MMPVSSNSFNTFDTVPVITQLPCFAHLLNLVLNHSEFKLRRTLHLIEAIAKLKSQTKFTSTEDTKNWNKNVRKIIKMKDVIVTILPFLKRCAEWTQVLSQSKYPTISLVRHGIRQLQGSISQLSEEITVFQSSDDLNLLTVGNVLEGLKTLISENMAHYFNNKYINYWMFIVAEFLDPRFYQKLTAKEKRDCINIHLPALATTSELQRKINNEAENEDDIELISSMNTNN